MSLQALHIGTSGYSYDHWKGIFYPEKLPKDRFFEHYSRYFDTVEINYSFYHIPTKKQVATWRQQAPEGFLFSLKAPKRITHTQRLTGAAGFTGAFIWQTKELREHLGVFLFQLPPSFEADRELLEGFIATLPFGFRYVFEFRHPSWYRDEILSLLQDHAMGLCLIDAPQLTVLDIATTTYVYFRFHGHTKWIDYCYSEEELRNFRDKIVMHLDAGREVFVYFNNDANAYAVQNAQRLQELVIGEKGKP